MDEVIDKIICALCLCLQFMQMPKKEVILDYRKHTSRTGCWNLKFRLNLTKIFPGTERQLLLSGLTSLGALPAEGKPVNDVSAIKIRLNFEGCAA